MIHFQRFSDAHEKSTWFPRPSPVASYMTELAYLAGGLATVTLARAALIYDGMTDNRSISNC